MDGYPPFANLVYDVATMSWVRMTQPLVDSLTSNLYLAVDQVESLLTDIKTQGATNLDGAPRDAFQRLRVSDPTGLFDTSFEYQISPNQWEQTTSGGGTISHSTGTGVVSLSVSTGTTDVASLQTRQYFRYQPGKSQMVVITGVVGAGAAGVTKRVGYFDANNGIFLEMSGTTLNIVRRTDTSGSVFDNAVPQASWNIDTLQGSGVSGKTLNIDKTNILFIDLQWLGVGRVRVGFDIDGVVCYAHEFKNAGNLTVPYMRTANLPVRYEIRKTTGTETGTLQAICAAVISEGGAEYSQGPRFAVSASTGRNPTARRAILSIRPKATYNGLVNRGLILPEDFAVTGTGTNIVTLIELVYNATFTGTPTWTSADVNSIVEYSVHGDAAAGAFTGGTVFDSFFITGTTQQRAAQLASITARYPVVLDSAGAGPRAISLVATDVSGTATVYGSMMWREVR